MIDFNKIMQEYGRRSLEQGSLAANTYLEGALAGMRATLNQKIESRPPTANDNEELSHREEGGLGE